MKKEKIDNLLRDKWYVQSGNLTPVYLFSAAMSGFAMKKDLGVSYSAFMFSSKNETGDLFYRVSDLDRLNKFFFDEWKKDKDYFKKARIRYVASQKEHEKFQIKASVFSFATLPDKELYEYINTAIDGITASVGSGHLIESMAIPSDDRLKAELSKFTNSEKELNEAFVALTNPENESFAQKAENELRKISEMPKNEREIAIGDYIKKWNWMRNSYAGRRPMTRDEIAGEANAIARMKEARPQGKEEKARWIAKLKLPNEIISQFDVLSFITDWQDERKKYILNAIDCLENLLTELSKRTGISINDFRYGMKDDFNLSLPEKKSELAERRAGSLFIAVSGEMVILTGDDYKKAVLVLSKEFSHEGDEVRGMAASLGTARGRVRVCITLESLNKVEEGDILVSSMTRPEYLPAMKKAAAFVTDEGGITCHAAIVAREMGKPCVIGTKVATKVLKDGDLVEVKGNHGVVIIKERAK